MPTISTENKFITLINVFKVGPSNQQRLVDLLTAVTEDSVKYAEGFISASLHRSIDGTKVTMYSQWRGMDDYQDMRNNSGSSSLLEEIMKIAEFEPGMYEVVATF